MDNIDKRLINLTADQRELLAARLRSATRDPALTLQSRGLRRSRDGAPLTYVQEGIWFLEQLFPDLLLHNIAGVVRIRGDFNLARFATCLEIVVQRHEILRTVVVTRRGQPYQTVRSFEIPLQLVDVQPHDDPEAAAIEVMQALARRPFDLARGPLIRAAAVRVRNDDVRLLLCMHHIISDGWSSGVLLRELMTAYDALGRGEPPRLSDLPVQYSDYAIWQREHLRGKVIDLLLAHWMEALSGLPPRLELPTDHPLARSMSYRGAREPFSVEPDIANSLQEVIQTAGVTPFMGFLAAYAALLHRVTSQDDFAIGVPYANRDHPRLEGLVGCFLNILPIRIRFGGNPTFLELLSQIRETTTAAYSHAELPFDLLVQHLSPDYRATLSPLLQTTFSFERDPVSALAHSNFDFSFQELHLGRTRHEISVEITSGDSGLCGWLDYNLDLFEPLTARRLVERWLVLLRGAFLDPKLRVGDLPLLSDDEHRQIASLNATTQTYPYNSTIDGIFAERVASTPDAIALADEKSNLSYRMLHQKAQTLAHRLRASGVGPESRVALVVGNSIDSVIAILGILMVGGVYVPIEPSEPSSRIAFILHDVGAKVVVTELAMLSRLPPTVASIIVLDVDGDFEAGQVDPPTTSATSIAYIMYTSGSTGTPKGVCITHRNVVRLVCGTDYVSLGPDEVFLLLAPLAFDASTFEIWGALLHGGRLAIAPQHEALTIDKIRLVLRRHRVTTLWLNASLFRAIVDEDVNALVTLKQLLVGGDVLPVLQIRILRAHAPHCRVVNGYGPTENTTFSCCHEVKDEDLDRTSIPIGKPIANSRAYVLDRYGKVVPFGVSGELYVGGDGVAQGYLNLPDLTAQRFIPDRFTPDAAARMYATGDRVRLHADGFLEFLGRIDRQVKIRGFRVDLGEVEAVLATHHGIREVALTTRNVGSGSGQQICAYCVPAEGWDPNSEALRIHIRERLPEYMVPNLFFMVSALPLTASGKIDRTALPIPANSNIEVSGHRSSLAEKVIGKIWCDLLHVESVDGQSNFFDLGGDSIRIIQMVARARRHGVAIAPEQVFGHQTLSNLATVAQLVGEDSQEAENFEGAIPLTPIQQWFFEQELVTPSRWNQWVLWQVPEMTTADVIQSALAALVLRHDALRLCFRRSGDHWIQTYSRSPGVHIEVVDLRHIPVAEHRSLLEHKANSLHGTIDLDRGILLRVAFVVESSTNLPKLLLIAHHLIIDALSWRVLIEDLTAIICALNRDEMPQLTPRTVSFRKWAQHLTTVASSDLTHEQDMWLDQPWSRVRSIPFDFGESRGSEGTTASICLVLAEDSLAKIRQAASHYHSRLDELLVVSVATVLCAWSGATAAHMDIEHIGRYLEGKGQVDVSRTIGWFTAMYPVALAVEHVDLGQRVRSIRDSLRRLVALAPSFGIIRYLTDYGGKLAALPCADVSFNFLGEIDHSVEELSFGLSAPAFGTPRDPAGLRSHAITIDAYIQQQELRIHVGFSSEVHRKKTIEEFVDQCRTVLDDLTVHGLEVEAQCLSSADFPMANLSQDALERLLKQIATEGQT